MELKSISPSFLAVLAAMIAIATLTSCGTTSARSDDQPHAMPNCTQPVRAAIIIDQSTSMSTSGTASISADQVKPLLDTLEACGGAVGIGFVREAPQPGIERIDFRVPTQLPPRPVQRDDEEGYEFADRVAAYDQLTADRDAKNATELQEKAGEVHEFIDRIRSLLARHAAKGTDLNSGIDAAEVFLSEPGIPQDCQKYLVIASDGLDNRGRPLVAAKTDARVLWINSTSPDKVLSRYRASRVESFPAAVNFIVTNSRKEGPSNADPK